MSRRYDTDDESAPLLRPSSSSPSPRVSQEPPDVTNVVTSSDDAASDTSTTSRSSCCECLKSYVPIEPLLFFYTFARVIVAVLTGFYFFDEASHMYGDPSMDSLNPCGKNGSGGHADNTQADNVQKEALFLTMLSAFSNYITAIIPTIFIGPAADRVGRRLGFMLPMLGTVSRAIVFLIVLGTGASVYYVYIGTVMEGLGGGFGTFLMTSVSAAADVTKAGRERGLRICIIEALQVFASALGTLVAGQWRQKNYTDPVILAACVGFLTLVYGLFFWPETLNHSKTQTSRSGADPQTSGTAATENRDGKSAEREARLSGAGGDVSPQKGNHAGPDPGESSSQGRASSVSQGYGTGTVEHVGINADVAGASGNITQAEVTSQSMYVSFPPTGRMSNPVRFLGDQRGRYSSMQPSSSRGGSARDKVDPETTARSAEAPRDAPADADYTSHCALACDGLRKSWRVYTRVDAASPPERRKTLGLCFACFLLTVAVNFSKPGVETVFRLGELCWTAVKESAFDSAFLVQHWAFILLTLYILQKRLKFRDVSIAIIGCVSAVCAPFIFIFATLPDLSRSTANGFVFASASSGTWARALIPMLRSMSSAVVSPNEQGTLFTSYACVELGGAAIFDVLASRVYSATVHVWKGIIFVIMTVFFLVVLTLLIILSRVQKRSEKKAAAADRTLPQSQEPEGTA